MFPSFLFSYLLMPYLIGQVGLSDVHAGFVYAAFGGVLLTMSIFFGSLIDRLLLRRTLLLQLAAGTVSMVLLSFSANRWWTGGVLFGPVCFGLAIGLPAIPVAVRRYTTPEAQTLGFGALFIVMNLGTAASQLTADFFRIYIEPLDRTAALAHLPAYSVLFAGMALVHYINYVLVTLCVRDVYVVDSSWTLARVADGKQVIAPTTTRAVLQSSAFWKFVLLSLATTGAKSIYRYLDSLYPIYMLRAPYPAENPADVPYMTLLLINPALACMLTPLFTHVVNRFVIHPFDAILVGCAVAAGAPFIMVVTEYWAVILFITLLTIGECLWAPALSRYANDFCSPGTEGMFYALATIPLFAAKVVSGSMTGLLLERFCSAAAACQQGWFIWIIIGCLTASSPVLLLVTCRWTRLYRA